MFTLQLEFGALESNQESNNILEGFTSYLNPQISPYISGSTNAFLKLKLMRFI